MHLIDFIRRRDSKQKICTLLLGSILMALSLSLHSMTLRVKEDSVYASGIVVEQDFIAFKELLANPTLNTLVLVNSPGGDLWTGLRIGRMLAQSQWHTIIAGGCISACSLLFLGGTERHFSDSYPARMTFVGIHGAYNKSTQMMDPQAQPQIYAFMKTRLGSKFNSKVMNQALYDVKDPGGFLKIYDAGRQPLRAPSFCPSGTTAKTACPEYPEEDACSLGLVTSSELVHVELPP
jgi:ATP-dependent protease ClpP protease subunit